MRRIVLASRLRRVGWISFSLIWIPFIAVFIGMLGMPNGSYDWGGLPLIARFGLAGTVLFLVVSMATMMASPLLGWLRHRSLQTMGLPAQATILTLRDTGTTINQSPVIHLRLRVQPTDRPPFEAETEQLINRLQAPRIQPGAAVAVRFDPNSHAVALDESPFAGR